LHSLYVEFYDIFALCDALRPYLEHGGQENLQGQELIENIYFLKYDLVSKGDAHAHQIEHAADELAASGRVLHLSCDTMPAILLDEIADIIDAQSNDAVDDVVPLGLLFSCQQFKQLKFEKTKRKAKDLGKQTPELPALPGKFGLQVKDVGAMVQGLLVNGDIPYNACEVGAASRVVAERLFLHTACCFGGIQDFSYDHLDRIIHI